MAQASDIKRRIRSIENTKQITRAMKMVAAAKLRRAQDAMMNMRPYADRLGQTLRYLAADLVGDEHPLFRAREIKRTATIVIAGDRGLCGGFNTNICRYAKKHFDTQDQVEHVIFAIGKRAIASLRKTDHKILNSYFDVFDKLSYILAGEICDQLVELFLEKDEDKRIDEAYVVYNSFVSMMTQTPTTTRLLPIDYKKLAEDYRKEIAENPSDTPRAIYELEPDVEGVLKRLISRQISTAVYRATLESYAAELAARMTAMDNATNNAGDMIERLTLIYNRARQTGITSELLDIVNGANALQ